MVAIVRAPTAEQARAEVIAAGAWPDAGEQRFCQPIDHPPGDRFPPPTDGPLVERWPWRVAAGGESGYIDHPPTADKA